MPELDGCAAVVTGAGRGIALALAGWGARVAVLDVNADGAAETAQLIQHASRSVTGQAINVDGGTVFT